VWDNLFSSSPLVWGALVTGLAALPIVIHWISVLRQRRVPWAAMELLLASRRRQSPRSRWRQWLLLASRISILLVALMMLGHVGCRDAWSPHWLAGRPTHHYILIDDSLSMNEQAVSATLVYQCRQAVSQLIARLPRSSGDRLTILRFSRAAAAASDPTTENVPAKVADWADQPLDAHVADRISAWARQFEASCAAASPAAALTTARAWLTDRADQEARVYLISDFRRADWQPGAASSDELKSLLDAGANVDLVACTAPQGNVNLAITEWTPESSVRSAGVPIVMRVTVSNFGDTAATNVPVRIETCQCSSNQPDSWPGQQSFESQPAIVLDSIAPGQRQTRRVSVYFDQPGQHIVAATLDEDGLAADNRAWEVIDVTPHARVLVIDDADQDDAQFVSLAMSPTRMTGVATTVLTTAELPALDAAALRAFDAVFVLDVDRLDPAALDRLEAYVHAGGGVAWFLGSRTDQKFINDVLCADGLCPGPISEVVEMSDQADDEPHVRLTDHRMLESISRAGPGLFDRVRIERVWRLELAGLDPAQQETDAALSLDRSESSGDVAAATPEVIAYVGGDHKLPLVVARPAGKGCFVLVTTTAAPQWNSWARDGTWPAFVLLLENFLAEGSVRGDRQWIAPRPQLLLPSPAAAGRIEVALPATDARPERIIVVGTTEASGDAHQPAVVELADLVGSADHALQHSPGIYDWRIAAADGFAASGRVALNVDTRESDLERADGGAILRSLDHSRCTWLTWDKLRPQPTVISSTALGRALLMALVALLLGEQILAYTASYHPKRTKLAVAWIDRKPRT